MSRTAPGGRSARPPGALPERSGGDRFGSVHRRQWPVELGLLLVCLATYAPSLGNGFVHDDHLVVVRNAFVADPGNLIHLFDPEAYFAGTEERSYRPLVTLYYLVLRSAFGLQASLWHLAGIVLHAGTCILLLRFVLALTGRGFVSGAAALLFAVHPAYSEAILSAGYHEELLAGFFTTAALWLYASPGLYSLPLVCACSLLALLAKENALMLPVQLLLVGLFSASGVPEGIADARRRRRIWLVVLLVVFLYAALRFVVFRDPGELDIVSYGSFATRLLFAPVNAITLTGIALFPTTLSPDHAFSYPDALFSLRVLGAIAAMTILLGAAVLLWRVRPLVSFGIVFFLISLLPVLNLFPISNPIAERYLYVPMLGGAVGLAAGLEVLHGRLRRRRDSSRVVACAVLAVLASLLAARTFVRCFDWRDERTLWSRALLVSPESPGAHNAYGRVLFLRGQHEEAAVHFRRAVELLDGYAAAHYNLGLAYLELGRAEAALEQFLAAGTGSGEKEERAFALRSRIAEQLHEKGRSELALAEYRRLQAAKPERAGPHLGAAHILDARQRLDEAVAEYEQALAVAPDNADALYGMALALAKLGRAGRARQYFARVARIDPHRPELHYNLGLLHAHGGALDRAVHEWRLELERDPLHANARYNLAIALAMGGRKAEAIAELEEVLRHHPDHALAKEKIGALRSSR